MFNLFKDAIVFNEKGARKKYKVTVDGDMTMASLTNTTKVETEWIITVLEIYSDRSAKIEIITFDSHVIEATNEAFKEMSVVANQFKKATQEVVCIVEKTGKLRSVLNIDQIKDRWKILKNEIITYNGSDTDIEQFFKINDEKFSSSQVLSQFVGQLEFFSVYFNDLYGTYLPKIGEMRKRQNLFNTNELSYYVDYEKKNNPPTNELLIKFKNTSVEINKKWIKKAYEQFHFVDIEHCEPQFDIEGKYIYDLETGLINRAYFSWEENVCPLLKLKTKYTISEIKI